MEIKDPKSQKLLDIYSVKLEFRRKKNRQVFKNVHVTICRSENGPIIEKNFLIPKDIDTFNLNWKKDGRKHVAVYYHRSNGQNYDYTNDGGISIYGPLFHTLEALVKEACLRKKHTK